MVIKRLLGHSEWEPEQQQQLAAEALAYTRVAHPAIVQLLDVVSVKGDLALVLEYVDGLSLARLREVMDARRDKMSDEIAMFVASRVFAGLAAAHSARDPKTGEATPVIHRDVSPENVRIPWDGFVKLGDFDLAKVIGVSSETQTGLLKGRYGYMAPEQVLGEPVTPRTDVYTGCLVLRELLLARPAFEENLPELELLRAMAETELPPIESMRAGISDRLADAMRRGLARDSAERTLTATEMVQVLRAETDMEVAHAQLTALLARLRERDSRSDDLPHPTAPPSSPSLVTSIPPMTTDLAGRSPLPTSLESLAAALSSPSTRVALEAARAASSARAREETIRTILPPPRMSGARRVQIVGAVAAVIGVAVLAGVIGYGGGETPIAVTSVPSATPRSIPSAGSAALPSPSPPAPRDVAPRDVVPANAPKIVPDATAIPPSAGEIVLSANALSHRILLDGRLVMPVGGVLRVACGSHTIRIGMAGVLQSIVVPCGATIEL